MTMAEAVRKIINIEKQLQCWKNYRILRKGNLAQGGITHVLIPQKIDNKEDFRKVQLKPELDSELLNQNIKHFSQAHGTLFTISPLIDIIGDDGCTAQATQILEGTVSENLPKYSKFLLHKLTRVRQPISLNFTIQDMIRGFSKWRETTTTSPSGMLRQTKLKISL
jgi:hypothetical protein